MVGHTVEVLYTAEEAASLASSWTFSIAIKGILMVERTLRRVALGGWNVARGSRPFSHEVFNHRKDAEQQPKRMSAAFRFVVIQNSV